MLSLVLSRELLIEGVSEWSWVDRTQREMKCVAVADCCSAINNDVALEKSVCSFPWRVSVGFETESFLNA